MKERRVERLIVEQERADAARSEWQAVLDAASECMSTQNLEYIWTVHNYKTFLKSLRHDKTEKITKKEKDLIQSRELQPTIIPVNVEDVSVTIGVPVELDKPEIDVVPGHAVSFVIDDFVADTNDEPFNDFVKHNISEDAGASASRDAIMPSVAI